MSVAASLSAVFIPASLVSELLRAIPFAPIGATCALVVWRLRRGRELSASDRTMYVCLAVIAGALLGAGLDLALTALRPDVSHGVSGGDVILGGMTGGFAGYVGAVNPARTSRPNNRWRGP